MKKIIIINGSGRCGKDTFVEYAKSVSDDNHVYLISTIDKVKEIAKLMGWNGGKDEKSRKFLSDLKLAWTNYNDGVFKNTVEIINNQEETYNSSLFNDWSDNNMYFVMCREPEEIQKFKDYYEDDCVTLLIRRPDCQVKGNYSDESVENYNYDYIIENNKGLDELKESAEKFVFDITRPF